jgi:hypothetical protein
MSDDFAMRLRLQRVAAYRELCRGVRRSGRDNVFFASLMLVLAYLAYDNGARPLAVAIYGVLAVIELLAGLFKFVAPSAEGVLLDGIVLLVFAVYNLGLQFLGAQNNRPLDPVIIMLGIFMLAGALGRFKAYNQLRRLFAERPSAEYMTWFDGLIDEIRASDPQSDELALDLPTTPHWKAKLFGSTAFFIVLRGGNVWVSGPDDFELLREKAEHGTGHRKALLIIHGVRYPEFEITDACWENYRRWRMANPLTPDRPPASVGEVETP